MKPVGYCGHCRRTFDLTEVRVGKCPYPDCLSDDIYFEDEAKGMHRYLGKHPNSNGERTVSHHREGQP